ncbi:MAG: acyltransferase [Methylococcales bacterium]|nr:MAG: acyltransferase [Methylococcales bacterium]
MTSNINTKPITATSRNKTFDLLRGLAILSVICVHISQVFQIHIKYVDSILAAGRFGVQLFFFVSALTMCYMWELRNGEANQVVKFYVRRFLRIAPLFWIAIPAYLWINGVDESHWMPEGVGLHQIFLTAMFLHGFWPDSINSVVPGGWSIAVEMTFYLIFPLLITHINNRDYFLYLAIVCYFLNVALINSTVINLMGVDLTNSTLLRDFL